jgi:hypothetical protein
MENQLIKFESLQKIGHRFFVKHPGYRGEGTLFYKFGIYIYMPQFSPSIEMTEEEVKNLLNN